MTSTPRSTGESGLRSRAIPALIALAVGAYLFLPLCDLHFDCGCTFPGAGDYAHCDIHTSGPPDCPWCHHARLGYAAMGIGAVFGLTAIWALPRGTRAVAVTLVGTAACLLGILFAGIATSLWLGLPVLAGL